MRVSPWQKSKTFVVILGLAAFLGVAGCSKPTGSVSGKVYYKGVPLKGGNVMFAKADGQTEAAAIGEDGSYTFDKIAAGPVKIGVETSSLKPAAAGPGPAGGRRSYGLKDGENPNKTAFDPAEAAKRYVPIPENYEDPKTSGKEYTVTNGKQEYDIKLD